MGTRDDEPRAGRNSRWRSINGRRIGGHHHFPGRPRLHWIDTGSGAGIEVPEDQVIRWRVPPVPTGTLSGGYGPPFGFGGLESGNDYRPAPSIGPVQGPALFPDTIPPAVQADTLRMMLARHDPTDDRKCGCGLPLGELTGLCWYGRQAQKRLFELNLDWRTDHPGEPDL